MSRLYIKYRLSKFFNKAFKMTKDRKGFDGDKTMKYSDYIALQKEKTCDPQRRKEWLSERWPLKLNGFKKVFDNNKNYIGQNCLCIGARTGEEVQALRDMGKEAIGIDLVPHGSLVVEGDFHNLPYEDGSFDFIFSNVFDHALYPDKFCSEAYRVLKKKGFILLHLQVNAPNDKYGVHNIDNLEDGLLKYLPTFTEIIKNTSISYSEFETFHREIVIKKI